MTGQSQAGHSLLGHGTVLPGFLDAHVHLALIDPAALVTGGIARVIDLGGAIPQGHTSGPEAAYAHQFVTAPGGYPTHTGWAKRGWSYEAADEADAAAAVDAQVSAGASVLKVTLNSAAGPVLSMEVLAALVGRAHERGLFVVAHAEGAGQAERAFIAGVDAFAHTPFSETLSAELIVAMATSMTWISTLDIHGWGTPTAEFDTASGNLRRFHAAAGRVLYGTDLGNGPLPLGLNRREIEALLGAGLTPDDVLRALCAPTPLGLTHSLTHGLTQGDQRVSYIPGQRPPHDSEFADWLCSARSLTRPELEVLA